MDGESWKTSPDGARTEVIPHHLLIPTILTIAPVATLGIWIVSESSFQLFAHQTNKKIAGFGLLALSGNSNGPKDSRTYRKRGIRRVFFICFILFWAAYFVVFVVPNLALTFATTLFSVVAIGSYLMKGDERRKKIELEIFDSELPALMQLMTILISSGVSPTRTIDVITHRPHSLSSKKLRDVIDQVEQGVSIIDALDGLAAKYDSLILRRFTTGLVLGIERGSSLSPVLIAQVKDARNFRKNRILQRAGRAEIALMIPVVFLILPISIIFALWPSYLQLGSFI